MPPKYTDEELTKALDKVENHLASPPGDDKPGEVLKALADVATGALALATTKKKKSKKVAKARKAERDDKDDKDDKDEDEDDEDEPKWLKDLTHDGKSEGEMKMAPDRDHAGASPMTNAGGEHRGMAKALQVAGLDVVDVEGYLAQQLLRQDDLVKGIRKLNKLNKALLKGIMAQDKRMKRLEGQGAQQAQYATVCAKALGLMLERREAVLDQPGPSRFSSMEKSIATAQQRIDAEGGTVFDVNKAANKELLSKAVLSGKISQEQATLIKRTQRLPAGLTLN